MWIKASWEIFSYAVRIMTKQTLLPNDTAGTIRLAEAGEISSAGIVSRTVLQSPEVRVVLFAFDAGQELTAHTNRHRALIQMLDGACEFFFNDRWQRLEAGEFLHMPPGHPHAVRAAFGPFSMLLTLGMSGVPSVSVEL